ncbi:MAG: cryptochrome/photolyase family protein [Halolamina sp.]
MTVWLLGTHLDATLSLLDDADRVLMIESRAFAARKRYHPLKLTLVFSAMRHFRDRLRDQGYEVEYVEADTFGDGLDEHFAAHPGDDLDVMRPASHGGADRLRELVAARDGELTVHDNELFVLSVDEFDEWAAARSTSNPDTYLQENFYRHVRRETGVLMDGDRPAGGEWNFDDENQETPPEGWQPPEVATVEPDELTEAVHAEVVDRYDDHWGNDDLDAFVWPVTRKEAVEALDHFVDHRLTEFGDYQDAMLTDEWALSHSLLSTSINLGLLRPMEVVERVEAAYDDGDAPINSVEGFIRQVLGWREFMRHVYRKSMPEMATANQLDQTRDLPAAYWTGDTDMACLESAVEGVYERGYAHHIERLMVLSNFALVFGADPQELNEWFHLGFVDAYHWVTTPNVVGMGSFATDALSSKPYASSGNYVNRMSDHCSGCPYAVSRTTGEGACPFNSLYWDFLKENEETLRGTGRMGLMYNHVDNKDEEEWAEIRDRAAEVRSMAADGSL